VVGVGYGIYWVSQSNIGRDPWGFEPGSGGPSDRIRQMAFEGVKQGAENGNVNAQLKLGRAYQKGEFVEANSEEALKWFRKAAENGSVDAQYAVGDAYKTGSGVPQDNAEALKWYRMAEATREGQRTEEPKEKEEDVRLR
jgi:TPR repeat protein